MSDQKLKEKINSMERGPATSWTKEDLWMAIEEKMEGRERQSPWGLIARIAAAFVIATSMWWWFSSSDKIDVEEELVASYQDTEVLSDGVDALVEGKLFIEEACAKQLEVCSSPGFEKLYGELVSIEEEKIALKQIIDQYGTDETATKALIQLENAESSITSELINIILS